MVLNVNFETILYNKNIFKLYDNVYNLLMSLKETRHVSLTDP